MPWGTPQQNAGYSEPSVVGPGLLTNPLLGTLPTTGTIAASGNWNSGVLPSDGYKLIACGATSSQAGAITIQRYLDTAGTVIQGPAVSVTLVAATANTVNTNDGLPFAAFKVTITNTGGSAATITNFAILMQAG